MQASLVDAMEELAIHIAPYVTPDSCPVEHLEWIVERARTALLLARDTHIEARADLVSAAQRVDDWYQVHTL